MTARAIGELAAGIAGTKRPVRRTFAPVRRNSRHAGEYEVRRWKQDNVFGAAERRARLKAAKKYDRETKVPGKPWGQLGPNGLQVYEHVLKARDYKNGRFDQAAQTIANALRISRKTVHAALARLKAVGLLDWQRRTEPIEDPEPFGPQVRQISNAYFLLVPKWLRSMLGKLLAEPPVPIDHAWAQAEDRAAVGSMLAAAGIDARIRYHVDEPGLAAALRRFAETRARSENASNGVTLNPAPGMKE